MVEEVKGNTRLPLAIYLHGDRAAQDADTLNLLLKDQYCKGKCPSWKFVVVDTSVNFTRKSDPKRVDDSIALMRMYKEILEQIAKT